MIIVRFLRTALFLTFVFWVSGYIAFLTHAAALVPPRLSGTSDAIVVLTGGYNRIYTGFELYADGKAPNLLITGVHKDVEEKEILAQWTGEKPLPKCCLLLGRKATATRGNATEAQEWIKTLKIHKIHLVTSSYHMNRALLEFRYTMPDLEIIPYPVEEKHYALSRMKYWILTFSEYNKVIFRTIGIMLEQRY